ncbi:histidine-tagged glucoamylase [Teratosphaeria destructans]|uniref:Histidine-tagged glucoamylase n=1 Tax=Teratosphaeria destructans TaxID=418781 RepID=A0A9W7W0K3_9PEZI|nr:histidine-tagged glucoamylase [Teratosphaeria destructans]
MLDASYNHRFAVLPGYLYNHNYRDFHLYHDSRYYGDQLIAAPGDHHSSSHPDDFIWGDYVPTNVTSTYTVTSTSAYPSIYYVTYTSVQPASTSYVTSTTTLTQTTTSISVQPASTVVSTYVTTVVSTQPASTQYITSTLPPQTSTYVSTYTTTQIVTYTSVQPASTAYITNTATATTTLPASTITNTATALHGVKPHHQAQPQPAQTAFDPAQQTDFSQFHAPASDSDPHNSPNRHHVCSYITTTQSASTLTSTVVSYSTTTYVTTIIGTTTRPASTVTATQTQTTTSSSTPSIIPIIFDEFVSTIFGEEVYVYGSLPQLGTMSAGVQMSAANYTSTSNLWFITINVTAGTSFTYSFYTVDLSSANADYGVNEYDRESDRSHRPAQSADSIQSQPFILLCCTTIQRLSNLDTRLAHERQHRDPDDPNNIFLHRLREPHLRHDSSKLHSRWPSCYM